MEPGFQRICVKRSCSADRLPPAPGTYMLLLNVTVYHAIRVDRAGRRCILLQPGLYVYVGSACGPGGLRARLTRHLCGRRRRLHWHIDRILESPFVEPLLAYFCIGCCAERIIAARMSSGGIFQMVLGVGASDDPRAKSHFYKVYLPRVDKKLINDYAGIDAYIAEVLKSACSEATCVKVVYCE